MIRALPVIGADSPLRDALRQMQTTGAHLAQAWTAEDTLAGLVMLEDAVEELVGEITDATQRP